MLSRGPHKALAVAALAALLACCDVHARHPRARRAEATTETPSETSTEEVERACDNLTDASTAQWARETSEDDMMALLMSYGGLPWQGEKDSKYLEEPVALPFLSRHPVEEVDDVEDEDHKGEKDNDEVKDVKDKDVKDKDAKDEDGNGKDEKNMDGKDKDGKDEKKEDEPEDDEGEDDDDSDVIDYFPDFFDSNPDESMKYNYSASDFSTFIRVERAISIPRARLLQAEPRVVGEDDDVPEVVEGVVGELWWSPDNACQHAVWNLAYVMLVRPHSRLVTRFQLLKKQCLWPNGSVSLYCEGPDAAAPFDNQGSDTGLLIAERLLGLPVHVRNATAA
ncbi:uncharacterized protein LOC117640984 [Thrips palmi]|uniref:Uncharacterized protein LOC117640984 n=1 Tax=Thrips palmi TaxID=161013 RepID=A0A6P8ZIP2_THRPL|nr:uncharacterized protein LOC117640984 [Thrips palmi]